MQSMQKKALSVATLLVFIGTARALDIPDVQFKEGLWKIHMIITNPGKKPFETTSSLCRNHAFDQRAHEAAQKAGSCTYYPYASKAGKHTLTEICTVLGSTVTTKSSLTSTGDTYYRNEAEITYDPPLHGQTQSSLIQEQTYVGSCPAGMNPGDTMSADGTITHSP